MPLVDDFLPIPLNGHPGVWISEDGLDNFLAGVEHDKGQLRLQIVRAQVNQSLAEQSAAAVLRSAEKMQWRATYGPLLGFVGGVLLTACVVLGGVYAGRALVPQ